MEPNDKLFTLFEKFHKELMFIAHYRLHDNWTAINNKNVQNYRVPQQELDLKNLNRYLRLLLFKRYLQAATAKVADHF